MQKQVYPLYIFLMLALGAGPLFAEPFPAHQDRENMITQELRCISRVVASNRPIDWDDVCYSVNDENRANSEKNDNTPTIVFDESQGLLEEEDPDNDFSPKRSMSVTIDAEGNLTVNKIQTFPNEEREEQTIPDFQPESFDDDLEEPRSETIAEIPFDDVLMDDTAEKDVFPEEEWAPTFRSHFSLSAGYRQDDIDWNISGDRFGANPNIISELTWSDLEIYQVKAHGNIVIRDEYVIDGLISYGTIFEGKNQDSDYAGDNRTSEFSRSNNNADEGMIRDFSGGLGYRFYFGEQLAHFAVDDFWITPMAGYSLHEQFLQATDLLQTIPASGSFDGLHSEYDTEWKGPWFGLELSGIRKRISAFARFEYHLVDFHAEADWNLRTDFQHPVSFTHDAEGYGLVLRVGLDYKINNSWEIDFNADFQDWKTDPGLIRFFLINGTTWDQQLNVVNWESISIMFGAKYRFN